MIDISRLDRALAYIEAHPDEHNQRVWLKAASCGTTACLAGHVVMQEHPDGHPSGVYYHEGGHAYDFWLVPGGMQLPVAQEAARLLGLDEEQADSLFCGSNTLDDLKRMRDMLADDPDAPGWKLDGLDADPDGDEYCA